MDFPELAQSIAFFVVFLQSALAQLCQKKSQWGFALERSHYSSFSAKDYPECLYHCLKDPVQCRSLTYDLMSKTCKLNSKTRFSNPSGYERKSNNIYKEMLDRSVEGINQESIGEPSSSPLVASLARNDLPAKNQDSSAPRTTNEASSAPRTTNEASSAPRTTSEDSSAPPTTSQASSAPPTTIQASSAPRTTSQASSTSSSVVTSASVDTFCLNKQDAYYDHPSDCTKYIKCKHSVTLPGGDCSNTAHFVCRGC